MTAPTRPRARTPRPVQRCGSLLADVVEADRDEHVVVPEPSRYSSPLTLARAHAARQ
jgi:hypothetical protein